METTEATEALAEDDSDSGSDDTDEEVEPKLTYERLVNDVPQILRKDAASCLAIHTKFLALGTHLGVIHILDHQGNNIRSKELDLHVTTVNQISIDEKGNFIGSCSNDGKVVVHGMYSTDFNTSVTIDRPVRSIALDPLFSRSGGNRRFILGEDKVVLYEKSFLSRYKPTILYQGEGPIRNIQWKDKFVIWSSDKNVRVYDISVNVTISVIKRDCDPKLRPDLYRCNIFWKDDRTFLIGWANSVRVCSIVQTDSQQLSTGTQSTLSREQFGPLRYCVLITSVFNTDFCICGISELGELDSAIVALTVCKDTEITGSVGLRPQMRVLEPLPDDFRPVSKDVLTVHGFEEYRCNDYHIDSLSEEGLYFILSPKDFIVARPRNDDDHVSWLLKHNLFKEAVEAVIRSTTLKTYSLLSVGVMYLDYLVKKREFDAAANLCPTIFGNDKKLWEEEVHKFAQIHQSRSVAPYLPLDDPLDASIYEMVLNEFLQLDPKGFLELVRKWPCKLYNIQTMINAVNDRMLNSVQFKSIEKYLMLKESLGELYIYGQKYDEALSLYIEIKNDDRIFDLIQQQNLFGTIHDKLEILMELNPSVATQMLLKNVDKVPVDLVVSKLNHKPELLFEYLHKVIGQDPTSGEHHQSRLVELYAEYAPEQLENFLRRSNNYALEEAFNVCQQRNLINEMIFLLGRMGNTKQALQQITHQLQNIHRAIEFCKEHDDEELWEDLINYSVEKPDFITVLLQNIGTHVDPIILINKIPTGMTIPGLRDSLVKIMHDYNLQISLRKGCEKILVKDCFSLLEKLNKQQRRGIRVQDDHVCQACLRKLITKDPKETACVFVFNCKHCFHGECLSVDRQDACSVCSAQKRPGSMQLVK